MQTFFCRPSYVCPSDSCSTSMIRHVRRFVHGQGCISLVLKQLEQPIPNGQNCILMWSWCHKCKQVDIPFYLKANFNGICHVIAMTIIFIQTATLLYWKPFGIGRSYNKSYAQIFGLCTMFSLDTWMRMQVLPQVAKKSVQ